MRRYTTAKDFASDFGRGDGWILWLGAATSVAAPTRVPATKAIVTTTLDWLGTTTSCSMTPELRSLVSEAAVDLGPNGRIDVAGKLPFEVIMAAVAEQGPRFVESMLTMLCASGSPNPNHLAASKIISNGLAVHLVTTNFDTALETATGLPIVYDLDADYSLREPHVIKLHGTISDLPSVAATVQGLEQRISHSRWTDAIVDLLSGKQILFVGYALQDWFDINPILRLAAERDARLFVAVRSFREYPRSQGYPAIHGQVLSDLRDDSNILTYLAAQPRVAQRWVGENEQEATARASLEEANEVEQLGDHQRVRALATLLRRMEQGDRSVRLIAAIGDATSVQDELDIADGLYRARRYRASRRHAVRGVGLARTSATHPDRTAELWLLAARASQAGGRPRQAARDYMQARAQLNNHGTSLWRWQPGAVDHYLRWSAENLVKLALLAPDRKPRERLAAEAATRMAIVNGGALPLHLRLQADLLQARIELAQGKRRSARERLTNLVTVLEHWGDPHDLGVARRLLAAADPSFRPRLSELLRMNIAEHRWQEAVKIGFHMAGFFAYGPSGPVQMAMHHMLVATWDLVKDVLSSRNSWAR